MATYTYLMVHPRHGRINVPQDKYQEYLDAGYMELKRTEQAEIAPSPKVKAAKPAAKPASKKK
jgi:hypothetical protein